MAGERIYTPSNIHQLPLKEHIRLKGEAESHGMEWYQIRQIRETKRRVEYEVYQSKDGMRILDEDGKIAIDVLEFDR